MIKKLNIEAIKKAYDGGMPIEDIVVEVRKGLEGVPLIRVLDEHYMELEKNAKENNH